MEGIETPNQERADFVIADVESLQAMPENTVAEIRAKKTALDSFILSCNRLLSTIHNESGSNDPADDAQEIVADNEQRGEVAEALRYARSSLERLGDKEEALLKKAA